MSLGLIAAVTLTGACSTTTAGQPVAAPASLAAAAASAAPTSAAPTSAAPKTPSAKPAPTTAPRRVSYKALTRLPRATTHGKTPRAPVDWKPRVRPSGLLVHPKRIIPVFANPGGRPIAAVPATQLGAPTWLPVIQRKPGWVRVLLPSRPNGSTGWLHGAQLHKAQTRKVIVVDRKRFRLTLHNGKATRSWRIGVGKRGAVTPAGRTFVLANVYDKTSKFSDIVLPLGVHSDTFTTYGGGPGTVGIHTWPTSGVYGKASSDGCIRVPREALTKLSRTVPLGTPVLIR